MLSINNLSLDTEDIKETKLSLDTNDINNDSVILLPRGEMDETNGITVCKKNAYISEYIKTTFELDPTATSMTLDISPTVLKYVIEFMIHKKGNPGEIVPRPLKSTMMESCIDKWDAQFIDRVAKNKKDLHDIYQAADYLDMKTLLYLAGACIALSLKGKNRDEMKKIITPSDE